MTRSAIHDLYSDYMDSFINSDLNKYYNFKDFETNVNQIIENNLHG